MKNPMLALLGLLTLLAALVAAPGPADDAAWNIRDREVPPPAAASDELRLAIAAPGQPDPAIPDIQPTSSEEWHALIEHYDSFGAAERLALAEHLPITVEGNRLAGVGVHYIRSANVAEGHEDHLFLNLCRLRQTTSPVSVSQPLHRPRPRTAENQFPTPLSGLRFELS